MKAFKYLKEALEKASGLFQMFIHYAKKDKNQIHLNENIFEVNIEAKNVLKTPLLMLVNIFGTKEKDKTVIAKVKNCQMNEYNRVSIGKNRFNKFRLINENTSKFAIKEYV